jgi:hypothetical protein
VGEQPAVELADIAEVAAREAVLEAPRLGAVERRQRAGVGRRGEPDPQIAAVSDSPATWSARPVRSRSSRDSSLRSRSSLSRTRAARLTSARRRGAR